MSCLKMRCTSFNSSCSKLYNSLFNSMVSSGSMNAVFRLSLSPCKNPLTCRLYSEKTATTLRPLLKLSSISAVYPDLANLLTTFSNTLLNSCLFLNSCNLIFDNSSEALSLTKPRSSIMASIISIMHFS